MRGDDWCHFLAKVHRSQAQRRAKDWGNPTLVQEREKYSYVVLRRGTRPEPSVRPARCALSMSGGIADLNPCMCPHGCTDAVRRRNCASK